MAAKKGWYDGREGVALDCPAKGIMKSNGLTGKSRVTEYEYAAYMKAYAEGCFVGNTSAARNPYGVYNDGRVA